MNIIRVTTNQEGITVSASIRVPSNDGSRSQSVTV